MSNVIELGKRESAIWICECGCSTFMLIDDGRAECSSCGKDHEGFGAGWSIYDDERRYEGDAFEDTQGNGDVDFARERLRQIAQGDDVRALVVARECGKLSLWYDAGSEDQKGWVRRKIKDAIDLVK